MHAFPFTHTAIQHTALYTLLHFMYMLASLAKKKKHTKALLWWPLTQPSAVSSRVGASKGCEVM